MKNILVTTLIVISGIGFTSCYNKNDSSGSIGIEAVKDDPTAKAIEILKKGNWSNFDDNGYMHACGFDGTMFKYAILNIKQGYVQTNATYSGKYEIEQRDGDFYISFTKGRIQAIYKLVLNATKTGKHALVGDITLINEIDEEEANKEPEPPQALSEDIPEPVSINAQTPTEIQKTNTGTVIVDKTYFYNEPDLSTKRKGYLIQGQPVTTGEKNGDFIYCIYQTEKGKTEGWMLKNDVK